MARNDFSEYLYKVRAQVLEAKEDLADFEQALKDGHITEDRLSEVKAEFDIIETNYQRLVYVEYLLDLPKRAKKKSKYLRANSTDELALAPGSMTTVVAENDSAINLLREEISKLKQAGK